MLNTPHLEGSAYQNAEQAARHVHSKCTELAAVGASGQVPGARREGDAIYVAMTGLPRGFLPQSNIERAIRRAFGMTGSKAGGGANPHPAHNIIVDPNDNSIRLYTTARR